MSKASNTIEKLEEFSEAKVKMDVNSVGKIKDVTSALNYLKLLKGDIETARDEYGDDIDSGLDMLKAISDDLSKRIKNYEF